MPNRTKTFLSLLIILFLVGSCGLLSNNYNKSGNSNVLNDYPIEKWGWKHIGQGLSYTIKHIEGKDLIISRVDPGKYNFSIYENVNNVSARTIEQIHNDTGSVLTFNGGFFTEDYIPTGLLISNGEELHKISSADLVNGIMAIDNFGEPSFFYRLKQAVFPSAVTPENYKFAIQNGPALLDQNRETLVPENENKVSSRTAIGIDKDGNIVIIVIKQSLLNPDNAISLYDFANLLKTTESFKELGLHSVLNLDGGSSTGIMIDKKYFPEMEKIQNAVIVKPKN